MTAEVLQFPMIPLKAADRQQLYRCIDCGKQETWPYLAHHAIYCTCGSGAEMRPIMRSGQL